MQVRRLLDELIRNCIRDTSYSPKRIVMNPFVEREFLYQLLPWERIISEVREYRGILVEIEEEEKFVRVEA